MGTEARQSPGCGWQGERRRRAGVSHKTAEPHESWGASPLPCPQADTAVGSASRLTAALAACRDLLVASSVHALLLHFHASSHLLLILQTLSAPICIFCSAPPLLSSSSSIFSFSTLFSPCAFHLVFLSCFLLLSSSFPSFICPLFLGLPLLLLPHSSTPLAPCALCGEFPEFVHSQMLLTASYATGQHKLCIAQLSHQIYIKLPR